jgi:Ca2+/Na+ antiporter
MDELDLLKKDWKKNDTKFPNVSEQDIYGMLHKKSSSIVKWIFIISVLEIVLWSVISFCTADENYFKTLENYHIDTFMKIIMVLNYAVIAVFIFLFYKNFKRINTTDNVKELMKSILNTRKTVQYYIWYNLGMIGFTFIVVMVATFKYDTRINEIAVKTSGTDGNALFWIVFLGFTVIFFAIIFGLFWLFYRLIYGYLLRRLYKNFEELKKIDL